LKFSFLINSLKGGGTEKVCKLLSSKLVRLGHEVDLYVLDDCYSEIKINEVNVFYLGKKKSLKSLPTLINLIPNLKTNSILIFNHELAIMFLFAKWLCRSDVLIISRMNNTFSITIKFKKWAYRATMNTLMKMFYRFLDFYIYQSKGIKDDLENNYYVKGPGIQIANPIEVPNLTDLRKGSVKEQSLLYVGRLVKQKNVIDILSVFKNLVIINPKLTLKIVGEGSERKALEEYCIAQNISEKVIFTGNVNDVSLYYKNASLTLLTSFNEGFPNVILESMSYGTPVIAYDCPSGPSEIIDYKVNGILVRYLDKNHLKESILNALDTTWDQHVVRNSISRYSSENIVRTYEKVLSDIEMGAC